MHADPRPALVFLRLGMEQRSARQRCPEAERWVVGDASAAWVPACTRRCGRASGSPLSGACLPDSTHHHLPAAARRGARTHTHARGPGGPWTMGPPAVAVIPTVHTPWIRRHRWRPPPDPTLTRGGPRGPCLPAPSFLLPSPYPARRSTGRAHCCVTDAAARVIRARCCCRPAVHARYCGRPGLHHRRPVVGWWAP